MERRKSIHATSSNEELIKNKQIKEEKKESEEKVLYAEITTTDDNKTQFNFLNFNEVVEKLKKEIPELNNIPVEDWGKMLSIAKKLGTLSSDEYKTQKEKIPWWRKAIGGPIDAFKNVFLNVLNPERLLKDKELKKDIKYLCEKATKRFGTRAPKIVASIIIKALRFVKLPTSGLAGAAITFVMQPFIEQHLYGSILNIFNKAMKVEIETEIEKAVSETLEIAIETAIEEPVTSYPVTVEPTNIESSNIEGLDNEEGLDLLWFLKTTIGRPLNGLYKVIKNIPINFYRGITFSGTDSASNTTMESVFDNDPNLKGYIKRYLQSKFIKKLIPFIISLIGAIFVAAFGWWLFSQFFTMLINFFKIIYSLFPTKNKEIEGTSSTVINISTETIDQIKSDLKAENRVTIKNDLQSSKDEKLKLEQYLNDV
jgi:hypothetical protein